MITGSRMLSSMGVFILAAASLVGCSSRHPAANTPTAAQTATHQAGGGLSSSAPRAPSTSTPRAPHTLHYVANTGADVGPVAQLGYKLFDTGPNPETAAALPANSLALVWLGNLDNTDCAKPGYDWSQFTTAVDRLAGNPKVYGYYISDEPHPRTCPNAVADIRMRADYIRAHDPAHKSFIVVVDGSNQCGGTYGCEFDALRPANTHVDLIGLDPYPCNNTSPKCSFDKIDDTAHRAAANGIPRSSVVPVFQTFGQSCAASNYYRMPSAADLRTMLAHWTALVPHPAFDYTYTWGHQGPACPTLVDAPDLQSVMAAHNRS